MRAVLAWLLIVSTDALRVQAGRRSVMQSAVAAASASLLPGGAAQAAEAPMAYSDFSMRGDSNHMSNSILAEPFESSVRIHVRS